MEVFTAALVLALKLGLPGFNSRSCDRSYHDITGGNAGTRADALVCSPKAIVVAPYRCCPARG